MAEKGVTSSFIAGNTEQLHPSVLSSVCECRGRCEGPSGQQEDPKTLLANTNGRAEEQRLTAAMELMRSM